MATAEPIDRTGCPARRHGNMSAYQRYGCRCADARNAEYLYYKHVRNGLPYRRRIDATGSRRRVQALYAIGHTGHTIAQAAGLHPRQVQQVGSPKLRRYVSAGTAQAIANAYNQLATTPGTSDTTRQRAAWWGFQPPQWWGDDIDDPAVNPPSADPDLVDDVLVARVLAQRADPKTLNRAEQAAAVAEAARRGIPRSTVAELLNVSYSTYTRLANQTQAA